MHHATIHRNVQNIHANWVQRENVLYADCNMLVSPRVRLGVSGNRYRNCVWLCRTKKNDTDALYRARNFVDNEEVPENHSRPVRPTIRIRLQVIKELFLFEC
jgi:hypothetical protein